MYAESKKVLDKIRNEYGCKGEMIFRTALQYLVEYGQHHFKDDEWVECQLALVDDRHNKAEAEGKFLFIGREFEKAIIECAKDLSAITPYDLLIYTQKEVWLSHEGGIDYERAVVLLKACMCNIEQWNDCQNILTLHEFEDIGIDDDEIIELGFGYVLEAREDEEYDL